MLFFGGRVGAFGEMFEGKDSDEQSIKMGKVLRVKETGGVNEKSRPRETGRLVKILW